MKLPSHAERECAICRSRRQAMLDLDGLGTERGLLMKEIAAATGLGEPHTEKSLRELAALGIVEAVPGSRPRRWRLAWRQAAA